MKKYRIGIRWPKAEIQELDVVRESDKSVWVNRFGFSKPCRESKINRYDEIHDTWQSAHERLKEVAEDNRERKYKELQEADQTLFAVRALNQN